MKYIATLVRGKTYTYQGKVYANGDSIEIDEATRKHFEAHAKDDVTVEGKLETRAKFKIVPAEAPAKEKDDEPKAARVRRRKPDDDDEVAEVSTELEA